MQKSFNRVKYLVGIDEAGRGPLAGPVTVGIVLIKDLKKIEPLLSLGLNDSKQMKETDRNIVFNKLKKINILYTTSSVGAKYIDSHGISGAIKLCIKRGLKRLISNPNECEVKLDGLLRAPREYLFQETIIKGDTKEPAIMLASVVAKISRDRYMKRQSKKYPKYLFEKHKGYGTKEHRRLIKKYGVCNLHRRSFCKQKYPDEGYF